MITLSDRANAIQASVTLELSAKAKAMAAAGESVLNLSAGEPDLPTPEPIVQAAHRALDEGHFTYTATPGIPALRAAIAEEYTGRLRVPVAAEQIVVSNGAKQALFNALATCTDPGDRVGLLRPYWVTYAEQARALGCEPVIIDCPASTGFRCDVEQLRAELAKGLKVLLVNSPSNPTGVAWSREDFEPVLEALAGTDTLLISDEIYENIVFVDRGHVCPLHVDPSLAERTCVVSGLSKGFAMTGWRVGFSIAPAAWSKKIAALQGHVTSNINAIAQQASLAAIGRRDLVTPMVDIFRGRRDRLMESVESVPFLSARCPEATFYLYLDASELIADGRLGADVGSIAAQLLEKQKLVLVPGSAFGDESHLRLSFAASDAVLAEAIERLGAALA